MKGKETYSDLKNALGIRITELGETHPRRSPADNFFITLPKPEELLKEEEEILRQLVQAIIQTFQDSSDASCNRLKSIISKVSEPNKIWRYTKGGISIILGLAFIAFPILVAVSTFGAGLIPAAWGLALGANLISGGIPLIVMGLTGAWLIWEGWKHIFTDPYLEIINAAISFCNNVKGNIYATPSVSLDRTHNRYDRTRPPPSLNISNADDNDDFDSNPGVGQNPNI
jgi:hypothetical protein